MRKSVLFLLLCAGAVCAQVAPTTPPLPDDLRGDARLAAINAACAQGYGKDYGGAAHNAGGAVVLRFAGQEFVYDDGKKKTLVELLDAPDIKDSFGQIYPLTNPTDTLPADFDPGRFRVEGLFKALYGATEAEVARNCVVVNFCGNKVRFNARCGAADALRAVGADLDAIFGKKPSLREYATDLGGTFTWRFIAGTNRLSNHSFGTAIDLNVKKSAYWRWDSASKMAAFSRKDWPVEIIAAFESHGFIWGGKWSHYDTMHFEFRPEIVAYARAHPAAPSSATEGNSPAARMPPRTPVTPVVAE